MRGAGFAVTDIPAAPDTHSLAGCATYGALWGRGDCPDRLIVHFGTPTMFRSQKRDVLWPEPRLAWREWARAWQAFAADGAALQRGADAGMDDGRCGNPASTAHAEPCLWGTAGRRVSRAYARTTCAHWKIRHGACWHCWRNLPFMQAGGGPPRWAWARPAARADFTAETVPRTPSAGGAR